MWHSALTVLGAAIAVYIAARLVEAVLPVLISIAFVVIICYVVLVVRRRNDTW